ncbi:MAG: hypothetical protein N3D74_01885 [Caldisericia bacterium]|nr:hypothetical protein [Caldisericia bacterium]
MEDRFKIKRKREFKFPKKFIQKLNFLLFLFLYILFLFIFSQKGTILKYGKDVLPLSFKIGEIENTPFYATSKSIYLLNEDKYSSFQYFIRNFEVDKDKIYILSDNLVILNKDLKTLKEIKKEGFYPYELYIFDERFVIKYLKKDSLSILFSLYDKNSYKELKNIKFENLNSMPYSTVFSNGEKILVFQNDGDLLIINFNGEILLQKNVRPQNEILFNPKGLIDYEKEEIILFWQSYSYTSNSILFLNFNGDIKIKFDIKSDINEIVKLEDKYYLLLNDKILVVKDYKITQEIYFPFIRPITIYNINKNLISIWEFNSFYSEYKILKINGKNFIFKGKFKDIIFNGDYYLILIDSKIYTLNYE